ncbi:XRE family transcriptional regulator [Qipengyuania sp. XHP0211]|uniref:helix-turn-helix domain-containing protein n=1 Tax=Qipengyuania sp. XHP0211 TaxID=3038079 RepID=UPI00241C7F91|nr:XRE family transcriptional regulator [Qipengyuania sp. XHP0211]MDG5750100.1 XRE family transcriptional regulator [Qipengyuania sp. XHP0211]
MSFSAARLGVARQRRLLNRKGFAALLGVTQHTVSRWEKGTTEPDDETIAAIANCLQFPVDFFRSVDLEVPEAALVSFRSQTSMKAAIRDAALSAGAIGFLVADWADEAFSLPNVSVPDLHPLEPEAAARSLREDWGLGERPISNMIHLLEAHGVRVFSLAENSVRVNAFSLWRDDTPFIFLNTVKSAESSRFDAAHELGHLVLHQDGSTTGREAEDQANRFASAFLMPRADILGHISDVYSLDQLIRLKRRWKVSVAALNYRLHKVGITTDWRNRDLCIQISRLGYHKEEPEPIERERSMVWEKILKLLWAEKKTFRVIAEDLALPESEVSALIYGVVNSGSPPPSSTSAPTLVSDRVSARP